ncbi:AraC family transcriptional regulator [Vallitalea pronyensis]|uniref:AraC family transcriptional regulator n=1 Tax=Vallitalea pronyensis TaxID=1348613 RepID=A0A8J8MHS0_9FIRM|nr:helix-turn-helix domain-containing protein [Vallitalea pronyensis]QUI21528.1 AraC family transcriptional regulator [Vallitalea pronyensis]
MAYIESLGKPVRSVIRNIERHAYHWDEAITIIKVLKGIIRIKIRGKEYRLVKEDFVIINIGEVHHIEAVSKPNLVSVTSMDASYCQQVIHDCDVILIQCNSAKYRDQFPSKYEKVNMYIDELLYHMARSNNDINKEIHVCIIRLLEYLVDYFDFISMGIHPKKFSERIIKRNRMIYRDVFLGDSPQKKLSLKEIAQHFDVSYMHLRKDVIERYGCGYKALKFNAMMESAVKLLMTTDYTITHIGYVTGFSDPKYLIKYFKEYYQCTPSAFRRTYGKGKNRCIHYEEYPLHAHYIKKE